MSVEIPWEQLFEAARKVRERAHAPYSRFPVGAAVLYADGQVVSGCNVENSSYGLSVCAERGALAAGVAQGRGKPVASYRGLLVVSGLAEDAKGERVVRSEDGRCALWLGTVDDLWSFGKPRGVLDAWRDTAVKAGVPSDPAWPPATTANA